jgi:hypothetical protein
MLLNFRYCKKLAANEVKMNQSTSRFSIKQVTLAVMASLAITQPIFVQSAMAQQSDED